MGKRIGTRGTTYQAGEKSNLRGGDVEVEHGDDDATDDHAVDQLEHRHVLGPGLCTRRPAGFPHVPQKLEAPE